MHKQQTKEERLTCRSQMLIAEWNWMSKGVFGLVLILFWLKIENGDENMFGLISENISSENENRKQLENENNKFSFSVFWVEYRNLICGDNEGSFKQV